MSVDWREIWEKKGRLTTNNLKELNGYEDTTIDPKFVANRVKKILDIELTDKILEVGCGAGMLAQYLDCDYVGVDYSQSLVGRHIKLLGNSVLHGSANDLIFKDNSFDKVFAYSVFQYFPCIEYAKSVIQEMNRVSKGSIFIGDLAIKSHRSEHLLFERKDFDLFEVSEGFYNLDRFNVLMKKSKIAQNLNP
jgi:SAM-dependent methyltransferase